MKIEDKIQQFDPNGVGQHNGRFIGLPFEEAEAQIVLLSVPWDVTVSFGEGTASGPDNILKCSTQLDLFDPDVPDAWKMGIYMRPSDPKWKVINQKLRPQARFHIDQLETGDDGIGTHKNLLREINSQSQKLKDWVQAETKDLLAAGKLVGIVGGEHSVPLGFLATLAELHDDFGILQIDAHMDLREAYEGFEYSHASIFFNALKLNSISKLVQVGIRDVCDAEVALTQQHKDRIKVFYEKEMRYRQFEGATFAQIAQEIIDQLPPKVYISFDIDGLNPNLAPNTGTPVPGGLQLMEAFYLIRQLVQSNKTIIGFDLCEVAGLGHEWDGNVGARVLFKLANFMGQSQGLS